MTKKMLIDATHKEETRVAITDGNKLEEYEYESQSKKPLKGNIYLAKVTRVEPSLQAAFVNFGGNRHGFLPFSEIHPDYFRIPVSDREALMAEQEALIQEHDEEEAREVESLDNGTEGEGASEDAQSPADDAEELKKDQEDTFDAKEEASAEEQEDDVVDGNKKQDDTVEDVSGNKVSDESQDANGNNAASEGKSGDNKKKGQRRGRGRGRGRGRNAQYRNPNVEVVGGEEVDAEQKFRFNLRRKYKIQEVIKRGQIMLIQVNKEERGNKGAAVGSYLSLPGRYCVLMPNSPRAGGVSRKIANYKDRARMRDIVKDLEVPKGMSVIVRTAGVERTKAEIKRDLDYLTRLWNTIRDLTLESSAPSLVYEEADLIKRSVRDLYTRDVEEIQVAGDAGFKIAKNFMKLMIPSHVKKVKQYTDEKLPLFHRFQIENQINEIGQTEVRLKSGGYLVINPTEALVSVDVNSGKSTKGRHIEETALRTNLEAAEEVARQLRLRDLGGLVVIDFIDMEDRRSNGKVERRMKDALSTDRARVQVGRISSFGLMELSRQRLNASLTEAQYETCKVCNGMGLIRTSEAMSVIVLRAIEEEGIRARAAQIIVHVPNEIALYILNYKRKKLAQVEERYDLQVLLRVENDLPASEYRIEVSKPFEGKGDKDGDDKPQENSDEKTTSDEGSDDTRKDKPRRGRRGGRKRGGNRSEQHDKDQSSAETSDDSKGEEVVAEAQTEKSDTDEVKAEKPKRKRRAPRKKKDDVVEEAKPSDDVKGETPAEVAKEKEVKPVEVANDTDGGAAEKKPKRAPRKAVAKKKSEPKAEASEPTEKVAAAAAQPNVASEHEVVNKKPGEKKKGWWDRLMD